MLITSRSITPSGITLTPLLKPGSGQHRHRRTAGGADDRLLCVTRALLRFGRKREEHNQAIGRLPSWTASVKTIEAGGPRGYDAGRKVLGRKRHAMVYTDGRALKLHAHPASEQDHDGAGPLLKASRPCFPFIERAFAYGGYAGPRVAKATRITAEIVANKPAKSASPFSLGGGWSGGASNGSAEIAG